MHSWKTWPTISWIWKTDRADMIYPVAGENLDGVYHFTHLHYVKNGTRRRFENTIYYALLHKDFLLGL